MSEPIAPRNPTSLWRNPALVGGVAFLAGIGLTAGALQLSHRMAPAPQPVAQPAPAPAPQPVALPPGTDVATLAAREQVLAGKLDQIELRLRDLDGSARNASNYATRAERLLIAAQVRRSIERGQLLGPLESQLRVRFGETSGEAVATIVNAARQPVTLEDLRLALDTLAPRLVGGGDGLLARTQRLFSDLIVLRQADVPSPRPADRLRRARRALDRGDVEAAIAEVAHMPGVAEAGSWTSAARRYLDARRALVTIERAALDLPAAPAAN